MHAKTSSEELLRQLSASVLPVEDAESVAARRHRVITHLADLVQTLPAQRQRRRRAGWAASISFAATVALLFGFVATRSRPSAQSSPSRAAPNAVLALQGSVQVIHRAAEVVAPPLERVPVSGADEVVTGEGGRARASLASGTEVDIESDSRVRLSGDEDGANGAGSKPGSGHEAVVLGKGRVTVRVPKLGPARSFTVETPEATVVVHGTAFSVERSMGAAGVPPHTTVEVTEGSVGVRHRGVEILLHGGDRWSSSWPLASEPESTSVDPVGATSDLAPNKSRSAWPVQRGAGVAATKGSAEAPSSDKTSTLAAENGLLQAAMAARQQGDARRAAQLAGELVTRYPGSPLIEEARVERMRALASAGGPAAAAGEARSYLSDYPRGFARQEANRILGSAPR